MIDKTIVSTTEHTEDGTIKYTLSNRHKSVSIIMYSKILEEPFSVSVSIHFKGADGCKFWGWGSGESSRSFKEAYYRAYSASRFKLHNEVRHHLFGHTFYNNHLDNVTYSRGYNESVKVSVMASQTTPV